MIKGSLISGPWLLVLGYPPPYYDLRAFTDAGDIAKAIVEGLGIGVIAVLAAAAVLLGPNGKGWKCGDPQAQSYRDDHGGAGVEVTWQCESK